MVGDVFILARSSGDDGTVAGNGEAVAVDVSAVPGADLLDGKGPGRGAFARPRRRLWLLPVAGPMTAVMRMVSHHAVDLCH